jgi:adenosylcobyric acid synthase
MRSRGIADRIVELARTATPILGICGGYQMLGHKICDPLRVESDATEVEGLGLLPVVTTFETEKRTVRATARVIATQGLFAQARGVEIRGYEIHMGWTEILPQVPKPAGGSPFQVIARGDLIAQDVDGAVSADGWIVGTYFHGLFDTDALRNVILQNLAARKKMTRANAAVFDREKMYDWLAEVVRANVDMDAIHRLIE